MPSAVRLRTGIGCEAALHPRRQCGASLVGASRCPGCRSADVLPIEPFDAKVSVIYGRLRAELQLLGLSLAAMDPAHALALDRALVSLDQAFAKPLVGDHRCR